GPAIATAVFRRSIGERKNDTPKIAPRIQARFSNSQRVAFTNVRLACPPSRQRRFGASTVARSRFSRAEAEKARAPSSGHDERAPDKRSLAGVVAGVGGVDAAA